ncbi:hypothetical protein Taro_049910, partial [Colocasia esculenta]|nr:hypothetical protein [Colocasia esculenta]
MLKVREQRPQDQGLFEISAGSPARSANPSSGSSSSASYRKTRKASSLSLSVCPSTRGCRAGGACHRRRGGVPTRDGEQRRDEPRREEQSEQQAPEPQVPVLPPPPPVDYGVFIQGLVQAMQTQAHTQAALQAQMEAQEDTRWYRVLNGSGKMLKVREQRPQDQGLSETSTGSPAWCANPSSGSSSSACYRKSRKASSLSSS